ncbi:MAG: T9SS type A sorting domain-containing protein [Flavobacteriales bacterium]|nr:T9SS type A sorting domain-containing protein [Flavobacteriales bacterium]
MSLKNYMLSILVLLSSALNAQNTPISILEPSIVGDENIVHIDDYTSSLSKQNSDLNLFNYTFAASVPNLDLISRGKWILSSEGVWIWVLKIDASEAKALSLDFKNLILNENDDLFVYNYHNNSYNISNTNIASDRGLSEFFIGDNISVEYMPSSNDTLEFFASKVTVNYAFKGLNETNSLGFGQSGDCEINANCNTVEDYKPERRAVVRIRTRKTVDNVTYHGWCTGTVIANAEMDNTPYIITADHCYSYYKSGVYIGASEEDLNEWKFYFNYESPDCENPNNEGSLNKDMMIGAEYRANSGTAGDADSDFFLLELQADIPEEFNAFWAGWDNRDVVSSDGYCYHHPSADIKKISTYTTDLVSTQYDKDGPSDTHWEVLWDTGVTEGGSSGSALLNIYGQIIGTLTGGGSSCRNPKSEDKYGKISYGWENDKEFIYQLNGWLDPKQTGKKSIVGYDKDGPKDIEIVYKDELSIVANPLIGGVLDFGEIETSLLNEVLIYDIKGSLLIEEKNPETNKMQLHLPSGLYIMRAKYKSKVSVTKFLMYNE